MKIAIVCRRENYEDEKPFNGRYIIDEPFINIFKELNVTLIPILSDTNLKEIENICDGLILPGSQTGVDPKHYNDVPYPGKEYPFDEYVLDKKVIDLFVESKKPILGICGGLQTLNVYFGGDLNQDIPNHKKFDGTLHNVNIESNSFLYNLYKNQTQVNSYHRQSIRKLGNGLKITAKSDDDIIEGIQKDNIIAVQWHPEILGDIEFFKEFIKLCNSHEEVKRITIIDNEPYLRQISKEVDFKDKSYLEDIEKLEKYCTTNTVFAMAAVQIGIPKRIIYLRNTTSNTEKNSDSAYNEAKVLINPIIKERKGHAIFLEGCASCLAGENTFYTANIIRPYEINVEYYDIDGNKKEEAFTEFASCVLSHEYDHLNGILHMDLAEEIMKMTYDEMKEYRRLHPYNIIDKDKDYENTARLGE